MRNILINLIKNDFKKNNKIFFLTADLGFNVLEPLRSISNKRFLNVGVSENNMMLLATGLSSFKGNTVYTYSISSFLILRTFEILRNYISNENRSVRLIGVGSGVSYDKLGKTHFNLDDINAIYSLKNILILNPSNSNELNFIYRKFKNMKMPLYFRINKNNFSPKDGFVKHKNIFVKKGTSANLIVSGSILNHIHEFFTDNELKKINIISVPIMNVAYSDNIKSKLVKGKILSICDCSISVFFEELKNKLKFNNKYPFYNFGLDHNKIKYVGNEKEILEQMGVTKKNLIKYLF